MKKILRLLPALALAGCSSSPPAQNFAPLDYSYLRPIIFKVTTLNVVNNYTPGTDEQPLIASNPAPPAATLMAMLQNRMQPSGQPGSGTITVQQASITEAGGNLSGQMTVDLNLTSADGHSTGFAEASVSRSETAPNDDPTSPDMKAALYQMTKDLMTAINVELPYQIAHNIPNWVSWTSPAGAAGGLPAAGGGAAPGTIQSSPLGAPGAATGTAPVPAASAPTPLSAPVNSNSAVPNYLPGAGPAALGTTPP
ncbi:MAG TPA: hypothetical protein VEQ16_00260 [Acidocella sp.]|jgi:hypothetical protein|nr:hypothetical protein [Acidocella sp.]